MGVSFDEFNETAVWDGSGGGGGGGRDRLGRGGTMVRSLLGTKKGVDSSSLVLEVVAMPSSHPSSLLPLVSVSN